MGALDSVQMNDSIYYKTSGGFSKNCAQNAFFVPKTSKKIYFFFAGGGGPPIPKFWIFHSLYRLTVDDHEMRALNHCLEYITK